MAGTEKLLIDLDQMKMLLSGSRNSRKLTEYDEFRKCATEFNESTSS